MTENDMTPEEVASTLKAAYGLTKKEERLLAYQMGNPGKRNIGEVCKILKTTPMTLFKTKASLDEKMRAPLEQVRRSQGSEQFE